MRTACFVLFSAALTFAQCSKYPALCIGRQASNTDCVRYPALCVGRKTSGAPTKLMIFGGPDHKIYLGCLSCSSTAIDSVFNTLGPHGSTYSPDSIFNQFGSYGGAFSNNSPCNQFAYEPPVIVDDTGKFYGELTQNTTARRPIKSEVINKWLATVCEAE